MTSPTKFIRPGFARWSVVVGACAVWGCHSNTGWPDAGGGDTGNPDASTVIPTDGSDAPQGDGRVDAVDLTDIPIDFSPIPDGGPDAADARGDVTDAWDESIDVPLPPDVVDVVDAGTDVPDVTVPTDVIPDLVPPTDGGGTSALAPGQVVIAYGAATTASASVTLQLQEPGDLVANAGFETGDFTHWTLTSAGSGWGTITGLFGTYAAISSYVPETVAQTVDLVAAGYTPAQLDMSPVITVREWYVGGGFNTADHFQFHVDLLDGSGASLATYDTGALTTSSTWQLAAQTFVGSPVGVRSVAITTTASDAEFWLGNYGSIVDQASVTVGTVESRYSTDAATWSAWAPFTPDDMLTLPSGAGVKTVYVQYRDAVSHAMLGTASDTITLGP